MTPDNQMLMTDLRKQDVAFFHNLFVTYPDVPPFDADQDYPEYCFRGKGALNPTNRVYGSVRKLFQLLDLDQGRFGSPEWNPLGAIIQRGDQVLISPNAVLHRNIDANQSVFASISHGSIIRAVVDYVYKALEGHGRITIADAPTMVSDFGEWMRVAGLQEIVDRYRSALDFVIDVVDLRETVVGWDRRDNFIPHDQRWRKQRDPLGYVDIDLAERIQSVPGELMGFFQFIDVNLHALRFMSCCTQPIRQPVGAFNLDFRNDQLRTFSGQPFTRTSADTP